MTSHTCAFRAVRRFTPFARVSRRSFPGPNSRPPVLHGGSAFATSSFRSLCATQLSASNHGPVTLSHPHRAHAHTHLSRGGRLHWLPRYGSQPCTLLLFPTSCALVTPTIEPRFHACIVLSCTHTVRSVQQPLQAPATRPTTPEPTTSWRLAVGGWQLAVE